MKCPHCQAEFDPPGWTLEETVEMAAHPTVGLTRASAEEWWAHYASVDFVDAANRKITNLRAALIKWKVNQPSAKTRQQGGVSLAVKKRAIEDSIAAITRSTNHPTDEQRAEIGRLRRALKEVNDALTT
jgi:hypothetical protein